MKEKFFVSKDMNHLPIDKYVDFFERIWFMTPNRMCLPVHW